VGENDTDAPTPPELRERIELLASQVRELAEPTEREQPPPARALPEDRPGSAGGDAPLDQLGDALIAAAERTAAEIRERALEKAARIANARLAPESVPAEVDHETLDALAAQTARLEEGIEVLRGQITALDSEIARLRRRGA
jgi:hypothetical protein